MIAMVDGMLGDGLGAVDGGMSAVAEFAARGADFQLGHGAGAGCLADPGAGRPLTGTRLQRAEIG